MDKTELLNYIANATAKVFENIKDVPSDVLVKTYHALMEEEMGVRKATLVHELSLVEDTALAAQIKLDCHHLKSRLATQITSLQEKNPQSHLVTMSQAVLNTIGDKADLQSAVVLNQQFKNNRHFLTKVAV